MQSIFKIIFQLFYQSILIYEIRDFEEIAVTILDLAYEANPENAKLLLIREIPQFGNSTCLQIAKVANDQTFLAHSCVKELLLKLWFNRLLPEQSISRVCL